MQRIEFTDVQRALFESVTRESMTAVDAAAAMEKRANEMRREADAMARQAVEVRQTALERQQVALIKIGSEHGVTIEGQAGYDVVDDRMILSWGEPESPPPVVPATEDAAATPV